MHRRLLLFLAALLLVEGAQAQPLRFEVSFPASVNAGPLTGRMFLAFARSAEREPRLQVSRYGVPFFGVDFENLAPGEAVVIDGSTPGYPYQSLRDLPPGDYYVQAVLSRYTRFERADGHTVWLHMDQWEGQNWRRAPGNVTSDVLQLAIGTARDGTVRLQTTNVLPPVAVPEDTEWVKHVKIQSELLTAFWGRPMYLGATVLLPRGYDDNPDVRYPTVYHQGHFTLNPPLGFRKDNEFFKAWIADGFPRFVAVTIQHPTPYFDDSYAVNSANNGPYGDRGGHGWRPFSNDRLLRIMADHITKNAPPGADTEAWKY